MIANAYAEALHHEDTSIETRSRFYDALASVISVLPANRPSDATRLFRLAILAGETVATTSLPQIASAAITLDRHGMLSEESTVKTIISALASLAHAPDAYEALAPMWSRSMFIEAAPFAFVRAMCRAAPGRWHEWFHEVLSSVSVSYSAQQYLRTLVDVVGVELIAGSLNQIPDGSFEMLYARLFTEDGAPLILYPDEGVYRISSRPQRSAGRGYLASLSRVQIDHLLNTSALVDLPAFFLEKALDKNGTS
ncbi:MAG: hypothetical protein IH855_04820 [Bacteroidetes bacterium]|nr:hypothetical protein [Bacteroidota bacterium]